MTSFQRGQIETRIQQMEAGRFQEFVLRFLPLFDSVYAGIARHGHTEFGKTRPGVPDLLKTFDDGEQIGCEAGTEEDYWVPPADQTNLGDWKPIKDGEKCLARMIKPVEIVLASSRSLSTKHPNAKTLIIDYFAARGKSCKVKLLTSADLAMWVEGNLQKAEVFELAHEFFPEAIENAKLEAERSTLSATIELGDKFGFPIKDILSVLKSVGIQDPSLLEQEVAAKLSANPDRFTLSFSGSFEGIKRVANVATSLQSPFGSTIQVLGAPKIGKSHLCWEAIQSGSYDHKWFSVPTDNRLLDDFLDAVLVTAFSVYLPVVEATAKVKGWRRVELTSAGADSQPPQVILIDNAHLLPARQLKRLDGAIKEMRDATGLRRISFVLLANRSLTSEVTSINATIVAPPWNKSELQELIRGKKIQIKDPKENEYFDLLAAQSCGHPLFAIALASKHPDRARLVLNSIKGPSQHDEQLSSELTTVLYQDILIDADQQNFVQRLAVLNGKSDISILDKLRTCITPQINTTVPNLVDKIGPAVLEGTIKDGLSVNVTFRSVAKTKIGPDETKRVFETAADVLCEIKDKKINADRFLDGVFYLALSGNYRRAAAYSLFLIQAVHREDEPEKRSHLKVLLDRLFYWKVMSPQQVDDFAYLTICSLRMMLGHYHASLEELNEASEYLEKIDLQRLRTLEERFDGIKEVKQHLEAGVICSRLLSIKGATNPTNVATNYLEYIDRGNALPAATDLKKVFSELIWRLPIEKLTVLDYAAIASRLYPQHIDDLANIAISIGLKAVKHPQVKHAIWKIDSNAGPGPALFLKLAQSSEYSHEGKCVDAKQLAIEAQHLLRDRNIDSDHLGPIFYQHVADIEYSLNELPSAIEHYKKSSELDSGDNDFLIGWNHFKAGLASTDDSTIVESLLAATKSFEKAGNFNQGGRALGALLAHHLDKKRFKEAIETAQKLATWFHNEKRQDVGPSIRLALAQMIRATHDITGKAFAEPKENFPTPDRKLYLNLPDSLRPLAGAVTSYQVISQLAQASGLRDLEIESLKKALYSEVETAVDRGILSINWFQLFQSATPNEVNDHEIELLLRRLSQYQPAAGSKEEKFFLHSIFRPFEDRAKSDPATWAPILLMVTRIAGKLTQILEYNVACRWHLYLDHAEGLANQLLGNEKVAYDLYRRSTQRGVVEKIWSPTDEAAFSASFPLWKHHPSIADAGKANFELLQCKVGIGITADIVINLGINMFRFWSVLSWTRLGTSDLRIKEYL